MAESALKIKGDEWLRGDGEVDEKRVRREKLYVVCGEGTSGDNQEIWCVPNLMLICCVMIGSIFVPSFVFLIEGGLLLPQFLAQLILCLEVLSTSHVQYLVEVIARRDDIDIWLGGIFVALFRYSYENLVYTMGRCMLRYSLWSCALWVIRAEVWLRCILLPGQLGCVPVDIQAWAEWRETENQVYPGFVPVENQDEARIWTSIGKVGNAPTPWRTDTANAIWNFAQEYWGKDRCSKQHQGKQKTKYPDTLKPGKRVYIEVRLNLEKELERKWKKLG